MNLTEDQILTLAPDESSKKSGKDLSKPSKWVSKGRNDLALWGECQGSGSKPYQTQIDVTNIAFKCSCPSRKFPCKHGLGLALLFARQPGDFVSTEAPAWVADWISKRAGREEKRTEKKEAVVDEAAQQKRQQNREQKVRDGISELHLWIKDIIRNGILSIPEKGYPFWEGMAKRMVDAQAPGLAAMVRGLGQVNFYQESWQTEFMDKLLSLYLVIQGWQNKEGLSLLLQQEINSLIGFTQSQDELKEQSGIVDTWLVLSKQTTNEDNLTVERNWLYGIQTGESALVLQFFVRGQGGSGFVFTPGLCIQAELVFYPSAAPLRALVKQQMTTGVVLPQKVFQHWQQVGEWEAHMAAQTPFTSVRPYVIEEVTPVLYQQQWWLQDREKYLMPLQQDFKGVWKLLAMSGGKAMNIAVLGKENVFEPVGVWHEGTYKTI